MRGTPNGVMSRGFALHVLAGRVRPDGANAAMAESVPVASPTSPVLGPDFVVTRVGLGTYQLTTTLAYKSCRSCQISVSSLATAGVVRQLGAPALSATGQVVVLFAFQTISSGAFANTDLPNDPTNWFHVTMVVKDSVQGP